MARSTSRELLYLRQRLLISLTSPRPRIPFIARSTFWKSNFQQPACALPLLTTIGRSMSTIKPIRHRHVVSSFLCVGTPHTASFRISVFKRSGLVRSYKHKWAACSGSVEESDSLPRDAALREILEETAISADQLELLSEGKEREIVDQNLGVKWTIYPFLWRWRGDKNIEGGDEWAERLRTLITLDWEHTDVQVVKPEEVEKLDTVEDLSNTIRRTLSATKSLTG